MYYSQSFHLEGIFCQLACCSGNGYFTGLCKFFFFFFFACHFLVKLKLIHNLTDADAKKGTAKYYIFLFFSCSHQPILKSWQPCLVNRIHKSIALPFFRPLCIAPIMLIIKFHNLLADTSLIIFWLQTFSIMLILQSHNLLADKKWNFSSHISIASLQYHALQSHNLEADKTSLIIFW